MLTEDHDVLTLDGWKSIKNIKLTDKIASLVNEKIIEYVNPTNIYKNDKYHRRTYNIKTNLIDINSTLNQQLYVSINNKNYELITLDKIIYKSNVIKCKNTGILEREIFIYRPFKDIKTNMLSWLILFGMFYSKALYLNGKIILYFYPSNFEMITDCLNTLEIDYDFHLSECKVVILNDKLYNYMKNTKEIPEWCLKLDKDQSRILIKALCKNNIYYTENIKDVNKFNQICFHAGKQFINKKILKGHLISLNIIIDDTYTGVYNFNKMLYSIEVPSEIYYVRRNGKCCWIGQDINLSLHK
jgi:hypothetical protein